MIEKRRKNIPNVDNGGRVGGQLMWTLIKICIIIVKSANVNKGGGGKTLIHKMLINILVFVLNPFLSVRIKSLFGRP